LAALQATQEVAFDEAKDVPGPLTLAASAENTTTKGRVVVFGNSTFARNEGFDAYANGDIFTNAVDWAAQETDLINITPKTPVTRTFNPPGQLVFILIVLGSVLSDPAWSWWLVSPAGWHAGGMAEMVRTSTWIALVVLLALVGFSFYLRDRQAKELAAATPTEGMAHLFDVDQGEPTLVRVEGPAGEVVEFSRDSTGQWVLNEPEDARADQAAAEARNSGGSLRCPR
jgi:hypothetical protein